MKKLLVAMSVVCAPFVLAGDDDAKKPVDWSGNLNLTAGGEAGNNENYSINLTGGIEFRGAKWRGELVDLRVKETVIRREGEDEDRKRDHSIYYDGDLKRSFDNQKFGTTLSWAWKDSKTEYDTITNYWDVGIGLNWQVYQGKKASFEFDSIGLTYRVDRERAASSVSDVWGQLGSTLDYKFSTSATLEWESTISFNPEDDATEESRVTSKQELTFRFPLSKHIRFVVDGVWDWDSAPLSESSENVDGYDVSLSMGIGASW